jgi:hypothetical protein
MVSLLSNVSEVFLSEIAAENHKSEISTGCAESRIHQKIVKQNPDSIFSHSQSSTLQVSKKLSPLYLDNMKNKTEN